MIIRTDDMRQFQLRRVGVENVLSAGNAENVRPRTELAPTRSTDDDAHLQQAIQESTNSATAWQLG